MFIKVPFKVEIPDSVTVAGIKLTVDGYYEGTDNIIYSNPDEKNQYSQDVVLFIPAIHIDFRDFEITGWVDGDYEGEDEIETTCPFDVYTLSSQIYNVARVLDNSCRELMKSTKKSKSAPKFSDMVNKQRNKNNMIHKAHWQDVGSVAIEGLKSPEEIANAIWGGVTNLIAHACDDASYGVGDTEISGGLAGDYYSRVAEALIPMLQKFIENEKWR